jgi:hypothetical protein
MNLTPSIAYCFKKFTRAFLLVMLMLFPLISCNKNEIKCEGCDKDTPWSNNNSSYCYPTQDECEAAEPGSKCEKCR